jgi:hypothetical protein
MLVVSESYKNCKNGVVSNQLTNVGREGDVCVGMGAIHFRRCTEIIFEPYSLRMSSNKPILLTDSLGR